MCLFMYIFFSPFLGGGGGGARENANVDFGTDLLLGSLLLSWPGAVERALGAFFRGESGGVFRGIRELMALLWTPATNQRPLLQRIDQSELCIMQH